MPSLAERYPVELDNLRIAHRTGQLNLYLGAGVSAASGLPTWRQLVVSMYFRYMKIEQWERINPFPNYLYAVGDWFLNKTGESLDIIIRKLKSNLNSQEFLNILYESLYNPLNKHFVSNPFVEYYSENQMLNSISQLITAKNGSVKSVTTYNFDNLLEQALTRSNFNSFKPIFKGKKSTANDILPIYHPHGFLEYEFNPPEKKRTGKIILSEDDYNSIANSFGYWANLIQLSNLTQGTGLMVGLSLSDRNLRRLIDMIAQLPKGMNNYILLKSTPKPQLTSDDAEVIKKNADAIVESMNQSGIKAQSNYIQDIQSILTELFQMDSVTSEQVFKEMRIKPIWFDEYNQIAEFINWIRTH